MFGAKLKEIPYWTGLADGAIILSEPLLAGASPKNEPQMNADERRFIVPGLHWRGADSLRLLAQEDII